MLQWIFRFYLLLVLSQFIYIWWTKDGILVVKVIGCTEGMPHPKSMQPPHSPSQWHSSSRLRLRIYIHHAHPINTWHGMAWLYIAWWWNDVIVIVIVVNFVNFSGGVFVARSYSFLATWQQWNVNIMKLLCTVIQNAHNPQEMCIKIHAQRPLTPTHTHTPKSSDKSEFIRDEFYNWVAFGMFWKWDKSRKHQNGMGLGREKNTLLDFTFITTAK